ncbi:MAG: hypothetical protein ACTH7W_04750 [Psychrobacter sp.]|uniref:hypothetical protein n=1 Tax=unclassified Psychrobacter TaxID=196806 RepID=UPI0017881894|nr:MULTISPECIES: hypothetical protein [unclassified Psychrobacter]MBE0441470.1 hypothetical protein [Psychrobacter sp. FME13]
MHLLTSTICISLAVLLTACNPLDRGSGSVVDSSTATATIGITEKAAFESLLVTLEQRPNADLDCLQFLFESNNDNAIATSWEFAAFEVHDDICGGDSYVGHVRDRYKVSADGSVMIYDSTDGEYKPF